MALRLSLNACPDNDCKDLKIFESTGIYTAQGNTGGYNAPNPEANDCSVTRIAITLPDGTVFDTQTGAVFANAWLTPSDTPSRYFVVPNTELGLTIDDKLDDGLYSIRYDVYDNTVPPVTGTSSFTCTNYFLRTCKVRCCIKQKKLKIKSSDCGCYNEDIDKLIIADMMLDSAELLAECGHTTEALNNLAFVQAFCDTVDCKECN